MFRRPLVAGVVVLGVYVGLAFLNSPRGYLGTDTGGKVATLSVMSESGEFDPDLGYWAEEWDPSGSLHPIAYTAHTSSGRWVNVTTLPALWVAWGLFSVGGYRAALLVPMAGSLLAAFAGLALLRRLGVGFERWAWSGFWLLAVGSPLTIYALDFWEHSLGVGLMAWGVVLLCDALPGSARRSWWWRMAAAGLLFGAAATMRTESLVYLAVAAVAWAAVLVLPFLARSGGLTAPEGAQNRRRLLVAGAGPLLLLAAAGVPLVVNEAVERRVVGSTIRATRVAGTAAAIGDAPGSRVEEAAITLFGLAGSDLGIVLGVVFAAVLVFAATRTDTGLARAATAAAGALFVVRAAASGLGFVPGLAVAWVLPAASINRFGRAQSGISNSARPKANLEVNVARPFVLAVGLGALPIVLATQFRGGAAPQWAGRYVLTSGLLLAVVGWAALATTGRRPLAIATGALAVAVTGFGLTWMNVRTHDVADAVAELEARPEPVLVSDVFHLAREGGATYGDGKRWLTLTPTAREDQAVDVLTGAGIDRFASIQRPGAGDLEFAGYRPDDTDRVRLFEGIALHITSWRKIP